MISDNLILDIFDELLMDDFAGGGGASIGIEIATGRHVNYACNHNAEALGMHNVNHPQAVHHLEDVFNIDPRHPAFRRRRVGLHWFSPDCTHFSKAKGGKPVNKKIRGLAFVMLKWAKNGDRCLYMENVEEIQTFGPLLRNGKPDPQHRGRTWQALLAALGPGLAPDHPDLPEMLRRCGGYVTREDLIRGFGYTVEYRILRACDYGAPTIRKRLYLIARNDGRPIVWPRVTHAPADQARRLRLRPYRTVAECIDWTLPCHSIFLNKRQARKVGCKRPLVRSSLRRIAAGVDRYMLKAVKPFMVSLTHQGNDGARVEPITEPFKTVTAAHRGEKALVDAKLTGFLTEHANASSQRNVPSDAPAPTICAEVKGGHWAVVSGLMVGAGGPARSGEPRAVTGPMDTVLKQCDKRLIAANMVRLNGDPATHAPGSPMTEPAGNVCAGGQHHGIVSARLGALNAYYGSEADGQGLDEALRTVSSKPRFGLTAAEAVAPLMTVEHIAGARRVAKFLRTYGIQFDGEFATVGGLVIADLGMRMLTPRELFRAQGFPESYIIDRALVFNPKTRKLETRLLSKAAQIRMCGNSVCPPMAAALVRANNPELCVLSERERRAYLRREANLVSEERVFE